MHARGVMVFGERPQDVEIVAGETVETTIRSLDGRRVERVPSTDRRVRYYLGQVDAAERRIAYATRLVEPIPKRRDSPVERLRQLAADHPDELVPCPACGGGGDARCVLCAGEGALLPVDALAWYPADDAQMIGE